MDYAGHGRTGNRLLAWLAALLAVAALACASAADPPPGPSTPSAAPTATVAPPVETPAPAPAPTTAPATIEAATPFPATPSPAAGPVATAVPAQNAELARIGRVVAGIRELPEAGAADVEIVGTERIAMELMEDFEDPELLAEIEDLDVLFKLLGLIPQDERLLDIELSLLGGAVLGLYNHDTGKLLVLGGDRGGVPSVKEESVFSHEFTHLLQDVNFDLSELFDAAEADSERTGALQALVEGEATFIEAIYAAREFNAEDLSELFDFDPDAFAALDAAPEYLVLSLQWPYTTGYNFVNTIWQNGGMAALDGVWGELPQTTEQIIHPEKYFAGERPESPPALPELAAVLGDGWAERTRDVLGEANIGIWLEALGARRSSAAEAAAGWGRDGYLLLDGPSGEHAAAFVIEWDDPAADALQFAALFEQTLDAAPGFTRLEIADATASAWAGPGGTLAFSLEDATGAARLAVAPSLAGALALLDSLTMLVAP